MTESEKRFPPSLSRMESRHDRNGDQRPEAVVKAEMAARAASEMRRKKNGYSRDSHWSVRRMFNAGEITGFRDTMTELLGEDGAADIERGMKLSGKKAASMVLQRTRARNALTEAAKGRGRPRTRKQRLAAMMVSAEAYMGAGLRRELALRRAGDKWGNTDGRFNDIYKKDAKLPHDGGSELLRAFFYKIEIERVDQFIERFRASEAE